MFLTGCSGAIPEITPVSTDTVPVVSKIDSILKVSDSIATSVKHTARQTDSAIKVTIQNFVYKNRLLSQKSLLVETVVIRDTVFIIETESKNFWGKTVKTRRMYNKKGVADSSSVLMVQDSCTVE